MSMQKAHLRLEALYELSKLFASFETVEQTFAPAVDVVTRTLRLRSAILMVAENGRSRMNVWPSESQDSEHMRAVRDSSTACHDARRKCRHRRLITDLGSR